MIDYLNKEAQVGKGPSEAERVYLAALECCPSLRHVELNIQTTSMIQRYKRVLKRSLPSIKSVTLFTETNSTDSKATLPTLYKNLPKLFKGSLRSIKFDSVNMAPLKKVAEASLPLATDNLEIATYSSTFDSVLPFLPPPTTLRPLKSLELLFYNVPDTDKFPLFLQRAGSTLESLEVGPFGISPPIYLSSYGVRHPGLEVPIEAFLNFPLLKNLTLHVTRPSLQLLESLSITSPLFEEISFDQSCWISFGSPTSINPEEIFPEEVALETLLKFKHLQKINLGYLPTTEKTSYPLLREGLKERGIELKFGVCREGDEPEPESESESDSEIDFELDIPSVYISNRQPCSSAVEGQRQENQISFAQKAIRSISDL